MDFEARKQEALNSLETRALETEKDYQKEYDKYAKLANEEYKTAQKLKAEAKKYEDKGHSYVDQARKIFFEAKAKGFKLKQ